ncbi:hypothetical protein C0583_05060 [Candidatus Parcubacteria bacterium]|nr:MAG: hypothetical protein C0583_05060 [Candidatus Parcubacteria bacterium]
MKLNFYILPFFKEKHRETQSIILPFFKEKHRETQSIILPFFKEKHHETQSIILPFLKGSTAKRGGVYNNNYEKFKIFS